MSTYDTIIKALSDERFLVLRDQVRSSKLSWAKGALAAFKDSMAQYDESTDQNFTKIPRSSVRRFCDTTIKIPSYSYADHVKVEKERVAALVLNEASLIQAADAEWEADKDFYASRVSQKIDMYLGKGAEVSLHGLRCNGCLEGYCTAKNGDKEIILETNMKTNYRYGENSANGDLTIYRQMPTIVGGAKGFIPEEVEAAAEKAEKAAKADKKALVAALKIKVNEAEKRKRLVDDLYGYLKYALEHNLGFVPEGHKSTVDGLKAKLGLTSEPPMMTMRVMVKEARQAVKDAKQAVKAAKGA